MSPTDSLIDRLPPPPVIHRHIGRLYRELALLRRLLRLAQDARAHGTSPDQPTTGQEAARAC